MIDNRVKMRIVEVDNENELIKMYSIRERKEMWVATDALMEALAYKATIANVINIIFTYGKFYAVIGRKEVYIKCNKDIPSEIIKLALHNKDCTSNTIIWHNKKEKIDETIKNTKVTKDKFNKDLDRRINAQLKKDLNKALAQAGGISVTGKEISTAKMLNDSCNVGRKDSNKIAKENNSKHVKGIVEKINRKNRMDERDERIRKTREKIKAKADDSLLGVTSGKRKVTTNSRETYGDDSE